VLQVFKSLPVVDEVHREDALPANAHGYARHTITLGWEERLKARGRRRTDAGVEFGAALPRGTILRAGDCFVIDLHATVAAVIERDEPVLMIEPRTPSEWGLFGYHIGNSHQPVMITDRAIVCPDVPGMEQVLACHGIPFSRSLQPFTPVGLAEGINASAHRHQP
jgi:urease accessory protein